MHEHNAFGLADEVECPIERRVAAAKDDDIFAFENGRILAAVMELSALKLFDMILLFRSRMCLPTRTAAVVIPSIDAVVAAVGGEVGRSPRRLR